MSPPKNDKAVPLTPPPLVLPAPVNVTVPEKLPAPAKVGDKNTAPTTTAEDDTATAGQRHINRVWEYTQAILAIVVAGTTLFVAGQMVLKGQDRDGAFLLLSNAFFVVVTNYLTRTNHQKTGGVIKGDGGR